MAAAEFLLLILAVFFCQSSSAPSPRRSYEGYKVLRVTPREAEHMEVLRTLRQKSNVDFWSDPKLLHRPVDIAVGPNKAEVIYGELLKQGMKAQVLVDNLQKIVDKDYHQHLHNATFTSDSDPHLFQLNRYHPYKEILDYLQSLTSRYSNITQTVSVGKTYEGRDLLAIKIGKGDNKPGIWVDAGIHAREWIAPAASLYLIHTLVTNYSTDPEIRKMVDQIDWYIVPEANPDGYEYTWTTERYWRKTRSKQGSCFGVDPNRNWDFHWGGEGTSSDPCSDIYRGAYAFSEPETLSMSKLIQQLSSTLKAYVTLHSFGQLWLIPYGYASGVYPPDYKELLDLATRANAALYKTHNVNYTVENSAELYAAAGASDDWAKGVAGVKYVYTVELRPGDGDDDSGFNLPAEQIIPTSEEMFAAIKVIANQILQ